MTRVIEILKKNGPMLSGNLAEILQEKYNISYEAARKAISRASSPVHKLFTVKFDKRQYFIYLQEQFNSEEYLFNLIRAFEACGKKYYQIIKAIENNGGYISKKMLASYVSAPVDNLKGHKRYDLIVEKLIELNLIEDFSDEYYKLMYFKDSSIKNSNAIELAKKTVSEDFCDWAKKLNLISYNSYKGFNQSANFAKFQWGFTAPSYCISNYDKPSFIIGDIIIGIADIPDVQFFIDKICIINSFRNVHSFMPILLASEKFTDEAFHLLKKHGIICATIGNLFSNVYANSLRDLVYIVKNASAIISNEPEKFVDYLSKISLLEGKMGNLVGDLFETCVGYYYSQIGCKYFELKKIVNFKGQKKEIDVYIEKDGIIKIIECKGIRGNIEIEYVTKWISENIPVIFKSLTQNRAGIEIEFELWVTGGFDVDTEKLLLESEQNTKKYTIRHLNRQDIEQLAKKSKNNVLINCIKSIFDRE